MNKLFSIFLISITLLQVSCGKKQSHEAQQIALTDSVTIDEQQNAKAYDAIMHDMNIPAPSTIGNPIVSIKDTAQMLRYIFTALDSVTTHNGMCGMYKDFWNKCGVGYDKHINEDQNAILFLKASNNQCYLIFFDPTKEMELVKSGMSAGSQIAKTEIGTLIRLPNPNGFKNLNAFSLVLMYHTILAHDPNSMLQPYLFELMTAVQVEQNKKPLMDLAELYSKHGMGQEMMLYYQNNLASQVSPIEDVTYRSSMLLLPAMLVKKPVNEKQMSNIMTEFEECMKKYSEKPKKPKTPVV